jgi:hypothetical protein
MNGPHKRYYINVKQQKAQTRYTENTDRHWQEVDFDKYAHCICVYGYEEKVYYDLPATEPRE